jgi:ketosteroid isomerase-like protein
MEKSVIENTNIAIKNRFVAGVFANDAQTIHELCDPAFELIQSVDLPYGGTYRGADGFMQFLKQFVATYHIEKLEQTNIFYTDDPDLLIFEFDFRATLQSTGKSFVTTILEPWRFRNGRVLTITPHYFNVPAKA